MIKDRIKELRRVKGSALRANEKNWRRHPQWQKDGMQALLENIGYAGALVAYEKDDELVLIDGHLRQEMTPDEEVPVLILDVTEDEADVLLATFDPISSMATEDGKALSALLSTVRTQDDALGTLLEDVRERFSSQEFSEISNETNAYYLENNMANFEDTVPRDDTGESYKAFMVHLPSADHEYVMEQMFELGDKWKLDTMAEVLVEAIKRAGRVIT